jgi:hypothetical protein
LNAKGGRQVGLEPTTLRLTAECFLFTGLSHGLPVRDLGRCSFEPPQPLSRFVHSRENGTWLPSIGIANAAFVAFDVGIEIADVDQERRALLVLDEG